jgi:hypothetical protein
MVKNMKTQIEAPEVKVQSIKNKSQMYLNIPRAIARAMGITPGQTFIAFSRGNRLVYPKKDGQEKKPKDTVPPDF